MASVVGGISAFIPRSHVGNLHFDETVIGTTTTVRFLECSPDDGKVVVSRRAVLLENAPAIKEGDIMKGTVRSIKNFGAFVDLGGLDMGLLHKSQISARLVPDAQEVLKVGQELKVLVMKIGEGKDQGKLSLSTRVLEGTPGEMMTNPQNVYDKAEENAKTYQETMKVLSTVWDGVSPTDNEGTQKAIDALQDILVQPAQGDEAATSDEGATEGAPAE